MYLRKQLICAGRYELQVVGRMTRGGKTARRSRTTTCISTEGPDTLDELQPWLAAVNRARQTGQDIPPFVRIARFTEPGTEWLWTVADTIEMLEIMAASKIAFPVSTNVVCSDGDSNDVAGPKEESQGSVN